MRVGQVLTLQDGEFVLSAQAVGARSARIILHHILPNALGPLIVLMTLNLANNILLESSLTSSAWGSILRSRVGTACWPTAGPICKRLGGSRFFLDSQS
jgi:peptide/nickel transport system permease protein